MANAHFNQLFGMGLSIKLAYANLALTASISVSDESGSAIFTATSGYAKMWTITNVMLPLMISTSLAGFTHRSHLSEPKQQHH